MTAMTGLADALAAGGTAAIIASGVIVARVSRRPWPPAVTRHPRGPLLRARLVAGQRELPAPAGRVHVITTLPAAQPRARAAKEG